MSAASRQDLAARARTFAATAWPVCTRLLKVSPLHAHIATQLFKASTSIGANLEEGQVALSRRDMAAKYAIALRESRESRHWLALLSTDAAWTADAAPLLSEAEQFVKMLSVSVRKLREE